MLLSSQKKKIKNKKHIPSHQQTTSSQKKKSHYNLSWKYNFPVLRLFPESEILNLPNEI